MTGVGAHGVDLLRRNLRGGTVAWDAAFEADLDDPLFSHMVDMVTAHSSDIFTARLSQTRSFFNAIRDRRVSVISGPAMALDFGAAIDILTIIVTHGRLARTAAAEMRAPGYWIAARRQHVSPQSFHRDPVMPIEHLTTITGFSDLQLRTLLKPLSQDNAVQLVRNTEGVLGVVMVEGISDDAQARRFMRR